ncbi:unnamed protein product [Nippostrongylus brasiliensis]|uniref:Peptidase_M13_N domain-containing protein n=1 Tax=Nippostrongylus brasiliensis TaxID=27835 RepID=A0A0N4Y019_NIPBR|nr:unnamed protein product [Nippostrongylus brasiliensis]
MSKHSPSFGRSPVASPVDDEVREVLEELRRNGANDVYRAEPCNASMSIPIRHPTPPISPQPETLPKLHDGIALFIVWAVTSDGFSNLGARSKVCSTRECIDTAFRFSNSIDDTIDPCENFYRYSCNKYHRQDLDKQLNFLELQTDSTRRALHSLLSTTDSNSTQRTTRLSRALFSSCMDPGQRAKAGYYPLIDLLKNLPCGPILDGCTFSSTSYSWERHSGMLDWFSGQFNLITVGIDVHPEDRSLLTLQFRPPDLSQIIGPIRADLVRLANPGPTELEPLLQVQLRQNFTNDPLFVQMVPDDRQRQAVFEEIATMTAADTIYITLKEFEVSTPQIKWQDFLGAELLPMLKLTDSTIVSVINVEYFRQLAVLVSRYSPGTLANYLVTVTAKHLEQFTVQPPNEPSWLQCVENLETLEPVQKLYIINNRLTKKNKLMGFLKDLKNDFITVHSLYPQQYMSETNRIAFLAGYPERLTKEDLVPIDFSDYFGTITKLLRQQSTYRLSQIGTHLDSDDTTTFDVLRPTIEYNAQLGVMVLPLAFLQSPVATPGGGSPMYSVFGTLGVTVNHFLAKMYWKQMDRSQQSLCLADIFVGFLNSNFRSAPNYEQELSYTVELADALKTTSFGFLKWQKDHSNPEEQSLPGFDSFDDARSMLTAFGTFGRSM